MAIGSSDDPRYERHKSLKPCQGVSTLKHAGYNTIIRNAGGLGVIADKGILNVSLIIPNTDAKK
ncbi:hypothetical protein GQR36_05870 [Enterococcus termitis]